MMLTGGVRRRSWLAVAAVLGLVGSLLAVGVVRPVGAVSGEADREALFSACVGPALESRGLVDVVGSFAEDAVNCLGHFGVTQGRTETEYDPGAPVLRWQMALFLSRAAVPAGVSLPADTSDVELTDLGGESEDTRTAVLQMAKLGIMPGFGGLFYPDRNVTRANMAEMLDSFLDKAQVGTGAFGGDVFELKDVVPDDEVFGDIDQVTRGEYSAIRRMFEVGVARGTSDDAFSPGGLVTRAQMAVFITRMLAHTVARPVGLTLQVSKEAVTTGESVDAAVSVRGSDLMALTDQRFDVFSSTDPGNAFGEDGRCVSDAVKAETHSTACEIVFSDEQTDPSGDWSGTVNLEDDSATIWAWSGDVGDVFDADDVTAPSVVVAVSKPGVKLMVSDDMAANASAAKFGASVTFTVQVVDEDGEPVALEGVKFSASVSETVASGAEGAAPSSSSSGTSYTTDEAGMVELSFRQTDPRSGTRGDAAWLDLDLWAGVKDGDTFEIDDKTTLEMVGVEDGRTAEQRAAFAGPPRGDAAVVWEDSLAAASVLKLTQAVEYHEASDTNRGASNTVTATLTDQYGDGVSRRVVEFASDDAAGIGAKPASGDDPVALQYYDASRLTGAPADPALNRAGGTRAGDVDPTRGLSGSVLNTRMKPTNQRGVATLTYERDSSDSGIETITARVKAELSVPLAAARAADERHEDKWDARSGDIVAERIYHYWAEQPEKDGSARGRLMVNDAENNRLILVGDNKVSMVEYDSNDHFDATSGPVVMADFEKDLKDNAEHVSVSGYQTDSKKVSWITADPEWDRLFPFSADEETPDNLLQRFGESAAADNGVIVVGAPRYQYEAGNSNRRVGRVYVYEGPGDAAPAVLEMPEADRASNTFFGQLVDISGDTIVVTTRKNAAYVFVKPDSGGWVDNDAPQKLTVSGRTRFGQQAAVDGNLIAVSSTRGVDIYVRPEGGAWPAAPTGDKDLSGAEPAPAHHCHTNRCLAVDEDAMIVVASPTKTVTPAAQGFKGMVDLIFLPDSGDWADIGAARRLMPPSVSGSGDAQEARALPESRWANSVAVTGDSLEDATVMISHEDIPSELFKRVLHPPHAGAVYVYTKSDSTDPQHVAGGGWFDNMAPWGDHPDLTVAKLTVPVGRGYGAFGTHADLSSDGNTIAVSQHYAQQGDWLGAVHVFTKPAEGWENSSSSDEQYVGPTPNGRFGWSVTIDSTNGSIWAALRQERVGTTTINPDKCSVEEVTVGEGAAATTVRLQEYCLRYAPVYMIER